MKLLGKPLELNYLPFWTTTTTNPSRMVLEEPGMVHREVSRQGMVVGMAVQVLVVPDIQDQEMHMGIPILRLMELMLNHPCRMRVTLCMISVLQLLQLEWV